MVFQSGTVRIEATAIAGDTRVVVSDVFGVRVETVVTGAPIEAIPFEQVASIHRRMSQARTRRN